MAFPSSLLDARFYLVRRLSDCPFSLTVTCPIPIQQECSLTPTRSNRTFRIQSAACQPRPSIRRPSLALIQSRAPPISVRFCLTNATLALSPLSPCLAQLQRFVGVAKPFDPQPHSLHHRQMQSAQLPLLFVLSGKINDPATPNRSSTSASQQ